MPDSPASPNDSDLVGRRIAEVEWTKDDKYLVLRFDDNTAIEVSGTGYDGLWDDVGWAWKEQSR